MTIIFVADLPMEQVIDGAVEMDFRDAERARRPQQQAEHTQEKMIMATPVFEYEQTSPRRISLVIDGVKSGDVIIQHEGRFLVMRYELGDVRASYDRLDDAKQFLEEMIEDDIMHLDYQEIRDQQNGR